MINKLNNSKSTRPAGEKTIDLNTKSTKGKTRLSKAERSNVPIPEEAKEILIGLLLGDAHIQRRSATANSRLMYIQSAEVHKEYFNHVFNVFLSFCVDGFTPKVKTSLDKKSGKYFTSLSFATMQLPCFNLFKEIFYSLNKKIVPINIYDLLTPRGLAFWIQDDGSRQGPGVHLGVYAFSDEDVDRLMFTLQDKFNLKCSIHYHNGKPRIYILKESMEELIKLTQPFFVPEMLYKLGL
jgi:hypothetical protein